MSITIPFAPDMEAKLREQAAAAGKDVSSFVREAVEEKLFSMNIAEKTPDQWALEFGAWMRAVAARSSSYPPGFIVNDDRESIYEGRGE